MFVLNHQNSVANQYLAELRDVDVQGDRLKFRNNLRRLGFLLGYEVSKSLNYSAKSSNTPLASTEVQVPDQDMVILTIMRAGLPFQDGFLEAFDLADAGFVGAWREEGENIEVTLNYIATPNLSQKTVILVDPMLATGKSLVKAMQNLISRGEPRALHIASVIAAPEGIDYLSENLKTPYQLWACAVDQKLDENSYIVPGLGDAGDLSFGEKL